MNIRGDHLAPLYMSAENPDGPDRSKQTGNEEELYDFTSSKVVENRASLCGEIRAAAACTSGQEEGVSGGKGKSEPSSVVRAALVAGTDTLLRIVTHIQSRRGAHGVRPLY